MVLTYVITKTLIADAVLMKKNYEIYQKYLFHFFSLPEINLSRQVKMVTMLKKFICGAASVTSGLYYLLLRIK